MKDNTFLLFRAGRDYVSIHPLDLTSDIVRLLAHHSSLARAEHPEGVEIIVFFDEDLPAAVAPLLDTHGPLEEWQTCSIGDGIALRESPDRSVYLCSILGYPSLYRTHRMKVSLAAALLGGIFSLLSDRCMLIHGALLEIRGERYALVGANGVGKSTAAGRMPSPWKALCDDMILAVRGDDGYTLHPLPTWSRVLAEPSTPPVDSTPGRPPDKFLFLEQASTDAVLSIHPMDAVNRFVHSSFQLYCMQWHSFPIEAQLRCKQNVLRHARRLVEETPCRILRVTRDGQFWDLIREESQGS